MHPILLKLGPVTLYSYGVTLVVAFLLTTWLAARAARGLPSRALAPGQVVDVTCWALLGGLLGGRLFYVLLQWDVFRRTPGEILALWRGGLVWYGGFLGGVLAVWLYARAIRARVLHALDQLVPFVAFGHAVGRVGCFFNGCCYGLPVSGCCGVVFAGHSTPVVPTQLIESLGLFCLFLFLRRLQQIQHAGHAGRLLGAYLIGYALLRFLTEFLRGDQAVWWAGLTLQQIISIGVLVAGLSLFIITTRKLRGSA